MESPLQKAMMMMMMTMKKKIDELRKFKMEKVYPWKMQQEEGTGEWCTMYVVLPVVITRHGDLLWGKWWWLKKKKKKGEENEPYGIIGIN